MSDQNTQAAESSSSAQGPGDKLQAARISSGLTIDEVANRMHLSVAILSCLEENNFDEITAPIFVKGYLRSYARIVRIDEKEIIQQYTRYYTEVDPPISSTSNTSPEINAEGNHIKWITRLVILALVILLTAWWWDRYQQPAETLSLDSTGQIKDSLAEFAVDESLPDKQILMAEDKAPEVDLELSRDESLIKQVEDESLIKQVEVELAKIEQQQTDDLIVPIQNQADEDEQATEALTTPAEAPALEEAIAPLVEPLISEDGLVIIVNSDTWTDIKDADGNKLVYDLLRSGQTISVTGKAPFRAFLGNGYGVSIQYQGEDIDLSAVIRADNTARIRIGQ